MRASVLFLTLLSACHHVETPAPDQATTLGWRLAPGTSLSYRYLTLLNLDGDAVTRREEWRYLVRSADEKGSFAMEGHFVTLGASITHDEKSLGDAAIRTPLRTERERLGAETVRFTLSLDGRMDDVDAGTWSDAMVHRLLNLRLPVDPIRIGEQWPDPSVARPFSDPIPSTILVQVSGTQRLTSISSTHHRAKSLFGPDSPPHIHAIIETSAAVLPEDARFPAMDIEGRTEWDLAAGVLEHRTLDVHQRGGDTTGESGNLHLEGWRVEDR